MLYPLTFQPIFKERVWGGRELERLFQKTLPPQQPNGESWEITDRPEGVSVIANGPLAGKSLRWLMETHRQAVLGPSAAGTGPFPLLVKILDAKETLSVQVHPPAAVAAKLHGEPKTEMWYIVDATAQAELYVGLKRGVTRLEFERRLHEGTVADCLHRIRVLPGDAMFLPSGRLHAIGAGIVLFEIQQNSDTTYRVFDWNRVGLDGKPRELHVAASLASIDFSDFEPELIPREYSPAGEWFKLRPLADDPLFRVEAWQVRPDQQFDLEGGSAQILGLLRGRLAIMHGETRLLLKAGEFCLLPACLGPVTLTAHAPVEFLRARPG